MDGAIDSSLLSFLEEIPDPRSRFGKRHSLVAMLAAACSAVLCGARSYSAIVDWVHSQPPEIWHQLGFCRRPPKYSAFRNLLMRVCPIAFENVLRRWIIESLGRSPPTNKLAADQSGLQPLAMDGKSLRGSLHGHERAVHLLSFFDCQTGCVLSQMAVDQKTNEAKAALELLQSVVLKGKVITGDAMFCQRDVCQAILDGGGHYLVEVKENQPTLRCDIAADFEPAFSPLGREATTCLS